MDLLRHTTSPRSGAAHQTLAAVAVFGLLLSSCGRSGPDDAASSETVTVGDTAEGTDSAASMAGVRVVSDEPVVAILPGAADQPTTTATTFPVPASKIYVVQSGDALSVIADSFGVTIDDIRRANPNIEDIHQIKQGQELVIPSPG